MKCFVPNPETENNWNALRYFQKTKCGFGFQIPVNYTIELKETTCKGCKTVLRVEKARKEMGLDR